MQYKETQSLSASGKFRAVAIADMNNDGFPDVVAGGSSPGTGIVWFGDGTGILKNPLFLPVKADVRSVAVGDFNEDGFKDIVFAVQGEASGLMVWENQSGGKWLQVTGPVEINNYEGIRTADINKDGHLDIVAANYTTELQGGIQVWLGNGKGKWSRDVGPTINGRFMDVAVADMNGDSFPDLIGAGWGAKGALKIWLGTPTGGWVSLPTIKPGSFNRLSVADIDNDGHLDILAGTYRNGFIIVEGDGKGGVQGTTTVFRKGSFWKVLPIDLNGDQRLDIIAGSIESQGLFVYKNIGGSWARVKERFPSSGSYYDMAAADLNKDNIIDFCAANHGEGIKLTLGKTDLDQLAVSTPLSSYESQDDSTGDDIEENDAFKTIDGIPEYKLGPGDTIEIKLWRGTESTDYTVTLKPDGTISFGLLDDLQVENLTAKEIDELITEKLKAFIKLPRVDVQVTNYNSKFVKIMGPGFSLPGRGGAGRLPLRGKVNLLEMISESGGLSDKANLSRIRVQRKSGKVINVDLFKVLTLGEIGQDVIMDDGDLVYVPIRSDSENRVYILGEVRSPGSHTFTGSEFRLLDAIIKAGVTPFSVLKSTKIVRGDPTRPVVISIDAEKLMEDADLTQNVALANGDFVFVPRNFIGDINAFLQQIQPILNLAYTPSYILDIPTTTRESFDDAKEAINRSDETQ